MRFKATICYDGTNFCGSQRQPQLRTVQGVMEAAISTIENKVVTVDMAGRTDRGVHATGQVAAFNASKTIGIKRWRVSLNALLPKDMTVAKIECTIDTFDPRRDAVRRDYVYAIQIGKYNPMLSNYALQIEKPIDIKAMGIAAEMMAGTHNFRIFSVGSSKGSYITTVFSSRLKTVGNWIFYKISSTAYFKHMIRRIIGLLVSVGNGQYPPYIVEDCLNGKRLSFNTESPSGLILRRILYD